MIIPLCSEFTTPTTTSTTSTATTTTTTSVLDVVKRHAPSTKLPQFDVCSYWSDSRGADIMLSIFGTVKEAKRCCKEKRTS